MLHDKSRHAAPSITWALAAVGGSDPPDSTPRARATNNAKRLRFASSSFKGVDARRRHDLSQSISTRAVEVPKPHPQAVLLGQPLADVRGQALPRPERVPARHAAHSPLTTGSAAIARPRSTPPSRARARSKSRSTFTVREDRPTLIRALDYRSRLDADQRQDRGTASRCCAPNEPLDLVMLDSMRVLFQNELWDRGFGDARRRHDGGRRHGGAAGRRRASSSSRTGARRSDASRSPATSASTTATIRNSHHVQDRRSVSAVRRSSRASATSTSRTCFGSRRSTCRPQLRQREERQHRRDRSAAARSARRARPQQRGLPPVPGALHELTTCSAARGGSTSTPRSAICSRRRSQGRGFFRNVTADVPRRQTSRRSCSRRTTRASTSSSRRSCSGRRTPPDSARSRIAASTPACSSIAATAARRRSRISSPARAGEPELPLRGESRRGERRVLLRELRRLRHARRSARCARTSRCRRSTLTGFIDRSDQPFSPTKGYVARLDIEHASAYTLSDYRYNRVVLRRRGLRTQERHAERLLGASALGRVVRALSSGTDSGVLHPRKRFYAGGANSVRGYAENQLGPRILTIGRLDLARTRRRAFPAGRAR